jgi:alkylated DNA repair dioxygenase AlkB
MSYNTNTDRTKPTFVEGRKIISIDSYENSLHIDLIKSFLNNEEEETLYNAIIENVPWYRVKYKSNRFKNQCTTPCWTNFYGGYKDLKQYKEVPSFLNPIIEKVSKACNNAKFNSILIRLYFDGNDNIAWHTDGRTFLGKTPTIGSLSLGHRATFEMRKMTNVWPCSGGKDNGIDTTIPIKKFICEGGDLLVMRNTTQQAWHHRVPKESYRQPRININFRYILPNRTDTERGQFSYYKYMVYGDETNPKGLYYHEIVQGNSYKSVSSLETFWGNTKKSNSSGGSSGFVKSISMVDEKYTALEKKESNKESRNSPSSIAISKNNLPWTCTKCTLINVGSVNVCAACFFARKTYFRNVTNNDCKSYRIKKETKKRKIKANVKTKNFETARRKKNKVQGCGATNIKNFFLQNYKKK